MEQTITDIRFPKLPLYLAAAVALLAVASVAVARLTTLPEASPVAAIPVLETRDLVFTDADDGSVIVPTRQRKPVLPWPSPAPMDFCAACCAG